MFHRRPFALTPEGEKLFQFVQPFFANLETVAGELQGGRARRVRIGAATIVLREHLPELFQKVRKRFYGLKLSLREGSPAELEEMLQRDEIDLAVTVLARKTAPGIYSLALLELPLALLVPKYSGVKSADELWRRDKIEEPLICFPPAEPLSKIFQARLAKLGVDWFPAIEVGSVDLVETYAASGLGIGVAAAIPKRIFSPRVRVLPLDGFPPVVIGALWRGRKTPLVETFLGELQARARRLSGAPPAAMAANMPSKTRG